jgi:hypothetical protein
MKKLFCAAIFFLFADLEGQNFSWANSVGATGWDFALGVTTDAAGNVYSTGFFYGTVDFDPGAGTFTLTASSVNYDAYVVKHDPLGNLIWAKKFGGGNNANGNAIAVDASGNTFITGTFMNTCDFDPGPGSFTLTSAGSDDVFVVKLDPSGNLIWAKNFGGPLLDKPNGITVDGSGNVYTTGYIKGTADLDPGSSTFTVTSLGAEDIFISKLDASGNFVWAKVIGANSVDQGFSIALDAGNNLYSTGYFTSTVDFDPSAAVYTLSTGTVVNTNAYALKLDANGNFIWAKGWGALGDEHGYALTVNSGNVLVTGNYMNVCDFDPGPGTFTLSSSGSADAFITRLDLNGNFTWARSIGGTAFETGSAISVDPSGNVYTGGNFQSSIDADPGSSVVTLTSFGLNEAFISKLDASGNYTWGGRIGGTGEDLLNGINCDPYGNVFAVGGFQNTGDYDPGSAVYNLTSNGYFDIFQLRLDPSVVGLADQDLWGKSPIKVFPNPFQDILSLRIQDENYCGTSIKIFDLAGILIKEDILNETSKIELEDLSGGIYIMEIRRGELKEIVKIIKQ